MKFLLDANLSYKLATLLKKQGYDIKHTDDLPNKEKSADSEIRTVAKEENRIIITKDTDFLDSHIIRNDPSRLLYVSTGNITNNVLFLIFTLYFSNAIALFENHNLVEISNEELIAHENK
jgi:predicted nuclease of predicted toxin-antitoxin system